LPVAGDWDRDGDDEVGIYRNGEWYLDANSSQGWSGVPGGDVYFVFGAAGDKPLVGNWDLIAPNAKGSVIHGGRIPSWEVTSPSTDRVTDVLISSNQQSRKVLISQPRSQHILPAASRELALQKRAAIAPQSTIAPSYVTPFVTAPRSLDQAAGRIHQKDDESPFGNNS
jgi:hypothetical protein